MKVMGIDGILREVKHTHKVNINGECIGLGKDLRDARIIANSLHEGCPFEIVEISTNTTVETGVSGAKD